MPDDDGPTMTGAPDRQVPIPPLPPDDVEEDDSDDTTCAASGPPTSKSEPPAGHEEEDRTIQQRVAPPQAQPARKPAPPPPSVAPRKTPTPPPVAPPPRTVALEVDPPAIGTDPIPSVAPSTQPSAQQASGVPSSSPVSVAPETEASDLTDDAELEDSITATAPRIDGSNNPMTVPGAVDIRTLDADEMLDETEVRTRPGHMPLAIPATLRASPATQGVLPSPRPAAGRPPTIALPTSPADGYDNENDDDGVTTEGPAPRVGSSTDLGEPFLIASKASPETLAHPSIPRTQSSPALVDPGDEPPTRPGIETASKGSYANEDDEEIVTTQVGGGGLYEEDSVTTQAPAVPLSLVEAALAGKSKPGIADTALIDDGTTQRLKKAVLVDASPADGEAESITTQAPGPLTNILRVIASGSSPDLEAATARTAPLEDDEEPPENRTAVMVNAPLKRIIDEIDSASRLPAIRPTGPNLTHPQQGSAAPRLAPSSGSGLRVARPASGSNERNSGVGRAAASLASDASVSEQIDLRAHAATELAFPPMQPSLHDIGLGKGPRYGLLVAVVAVISIIVPVTLFLALRRDGEPIPPSTPSEPASEIQKHDPVRAKAERGKNGKTLQPTVPSAPASGSASAPASAAPSASAGTKPPLKR